MRTQKGEEGFSLIEVLAAITLMAVSAGLISQALRFGVVASDRLTAKADAMTARVVARRTLARLVSRALPPGPETIFEGGPYRLSFTRQALSDTGPGPLVLAELESDGKSLILRECTAVRQPRGLTCREPKSERLRAEFDAPVSFFYKGQSNPASDRGADRWAGKEYLPNLIRVEGSSYPLSIRFDLGPPW